MILLSIKLPVKPINEVPADTRGCRDCRTDKCLNTACFRAYFVDKMTVCMNFSVLLGFGTLFHFACMSQSFNSKLYLDCKQKKNATLHLSYHTSCLPLQWLHSYCTAAILPSNSKRLFPIIMPFNAIRIVIRLQMKYLHDTVVWVHQCGEVRKAAGGSFGRAEWLQPDLVLISKPSSCSSIGWWRARHGVWETLVDSFVVKDLLLKCRHDDRKEVNFNVMYHRFIVFF